MITTVLGTCDVCGKPDRDVVECTLFHMRAFVCEECREQHPLRPVETKRKTT